MKFFRNLLVATAAIAAMSATAAFAEVTETSFALNDYDATNNKISVTAADITALKDDFGAQVTVVVVPQGTTTVTENDIYYINQDDQNGITTILAGMGMKTLSSTITDYEVWVGGSNGTIKKASFSTAKTPSYTLGDVDGVKGINANDATAIAKHVAEIAELTGDNLKAADCDGVKGVNANDATAVAKFVAEIIDKLTPPPAE